MTSDASKSELWLLALEASDCIEEWWLPEIHVESEDYNLLKVLEILTLIHFYSKTRKFGINFFLAISVVLEGKAKPKTWQESRRFDLKSINKDQCL